jgi:hypothetical protein
MSLRVPKDHPLQELAEKLGGVARITFRRQCYVNVTACGVHYLVTQHDGIGDYYVSAPYRSGEVKKWTFKNIDQLLEFFRSNGANC